MALPIRNLPTPASAEINKRGFLYQASLTLSPQSPSLFLLLEIPYRFRRLLCRLKEKDNGNNFFEGGGGDNAMNLIVLCSKEFVNFLIQKFPLSLGSRESC